MKQIKQIFFGRWESDFKIFFSPWLNKFTIALKLNSHLKMFVIRASNCCSVSLPLIYSTAYQTTPTTKKWCRRKNNKFTLIFRESIARIIYIWLKKHFFWNENQKKVLTRTFLVDPVGWRQSKPTYF